MREMFRIIKRRFCSTPLITACARWLLITGIPLTVAYSSTSALAAAGANTSIPITEQWPMGGQNLRDTRHQPFESIIGTSNVSQLVVKWSFPTPSAVEATPAVVNGVVYFPDKIGNFYALDATTGAVIWKHRITDWTGLPVDRSRGDPAIAGDMLYIGDQGGHYGTYSNGQLSGAGARLIAVDTATGNLKWVTQVEKFPLGNINSSPVVYKGIVYIGISVGPEEDFPGTYPDYPCCSGQGSVVALNRYTGQILWQTYDMPSSPSNPGGYSGGSIWGRTPAVDASTGSIYVGTGNNYWVPQDVQTCIATADAMGEPKSVCDSVDNFGQDYADSILALDLNTGAIKWGFKADPYDATNAACSLMLATCPSPGGTDSDFAAGPNLFDTVINGQKVTVVGEGEKKAIYWALNADDGTLLWSTHVGPGLGGREWGTAYDGQRIYVAFPNLLHKTYTLQPSGTQWNGGNWTALDPATGSILWQTATLGTACVNFKNGTTGGCGTEGPISVANGVVYVGEINKAHGALTMHALDAATGQILWSFASGAVVHASPAIVGDTLYWGSGYEDNTRGAMYAFTLPGG
jgi:polyvinyl alcohol dehydrogenase (cytochrome)